MSNRNCNEEVTVDFIVREGDPEMKAVEDDIRANLQAIGVKVNTLFLDSEAYADAELNGNYNLLFTRTWGAPYDPHSYLNSWSVPSHVEYSAIGGVVAPLTRDLLISKIEKVQTELDEVKIQAQWKEIMQDVHSQAIFMPLWGARIPYVLNRRLSGFQPAEQAYSIPLHTVQVVSGSSNVTVSPGVGSIFQSTGPINPHQYSPNVLWAQDWIYEGLVSYGQDGDIVPALATSWVIEPTEEGQRVTFQLRPNVVFHDGTPWDCSAAVLNFDHVFSDIVRQRHQWLGVGQHLKSWTCTGDLELVLETSSPFYPLLQELTYIRPLRFASPSAFSQGLDSDPDLHNSCETGHFGGSRWDFLEEEVTCLGLTAPIGTGPLKYVSREEGPDGTDNKVIFSRNDDYWGPKAGVETATVVRYDTNEDVKAALLAGDLDMALGIGPLTAHQVQEFKVSHSDRFYVRHSDVIQHALLVFNTNRAPTDSALMRRAIIHAIDKTSFLEEDFAGLEQPVTQLLPLNAPYANVDLNPKWGYDLEKAELLVCPASVTEESSLSGGAIAGIAIGGAVLLGLLGLVLRMIQKERSGTPMFKPTIDETEGKEVEMD